MDGKTAIRFVSQLSQKTPDEVKHGVAEIVARAGTSSEFDRALYMLTKDPRLVFDAGGMTVILQRAHVNVFFAAALSNMMLLDEAKRCAMESHHVFLRLLDSDNVDVIMHATRALSDVSDFHDQLRDIIPALAKHIHTLGEYIVGALANIAIHPRNKSYVSETCLADVLNLGRHVDDSWTLYHVARFCMAVTTINCDSFIELGGLDVLRRMYNDPEVQTEALRALTNVSMRTNVDAELVHVLPLLRSANIPNAAFRFMLNVSRHLLIDHMDVFVNALDDDRLCVNAASLVCYIVLGDDLAKRAAVNLGCIEKIVPRLDRKNFTRAAFALLHSEDAVRRFVDWGGALALLNVTDEDAFGCLANVCVYDPAACVDAIPNAVRASYAGSLQAGRFLQLVSNGFVYRDYTTRHEYLGDDTIVFLVSNDEQKIQTSSRVLSQCAYFDSLLNGGWGDVDVRIDASAATIETMLEFLITGKCTPIDLFETHAAAKYYGVENLAAFVEVKLLNESPSIVLKRIEDAPRLLLWCHYKMISSGASYEDQNDFVKKDADVLRTVWSHF